MLAETAATWVCWAVSEATRRLIHGFTTRTPACSNLSSLGFGWESAWESACDPLGIRLGSAWDPSLGVAIRSYHQYARRVQCMLCGYTMGPEPTPL